MREQIGVAQKIGYSFLGLLAGNAAMLLYVVNTVIRQRVSFSLPHGQPLPEIWSGILVALLFYTPFSMLGWALVGLPTVLFLKAKFVSRLHWLLAALIGAVLGPLAFLPIFLLLSPYKTHLSVADFKGSEPLWICSILASTVAFVVYCALMRGAVRSNKEPLHNEAAQERGNRHIA